MASKLLNIIFKLGLGIIFASYGHCQEYSRHIQDFLEHNFMHNQTGLVVQSLPDNKILYQHNADKLFVPASLVKLFTLASSLEELSPQFKFKTSVKWNPKYFENNKLKNDLAIVFSGDPSFTQDNLEQLILDVKKQGVNTITGNLIIDDTLFSEWHGDGWAIDDLSWGYAAPSSSIVIAENKIPISIKPINTLGQPVEFFIDHRHKALYPFNINSKVIAVTKQQSDYDCKLQIKINHQNDPFFSGCAQIDPSTQNISLALNSPRKYLKKLLILYLHQHNINLIGTIVFAKCPNKFIDLKIHKSLPLFDLLKIMMKNSNNMYANNIGKALGAKLYDHGSFKTSTKAIMNILQKKFTINTSTLDLFDTSGLSIYNVATPNHFLRLLQVIYNDRNLQENVIKILSKPGERGTLKNRLTSNDLRGNVLAKTGSLRNSSGLAGYIKTKTGRKLAFVFMVNNMIQNNSHIKQLTDELCELLINYG